MDMKRDPGLANCTLTKLSERLQGISDRWLNLGDNQRSILANIIISAEWQEERAAEAYLTGLEDALNCYSPDDSATDWADKIRALKNAQRLPQDRSGE